MYSSIRCKPGLYAIAQEENLAFGFAKKGSKYGDRKAEKDLRSKGYEGEIIFYNYLDPKETYIFRVA